MDTQDAWLRHHIGRPTRPISLALSVSSATFTVRTGTLQDLAALVEMDLFAQTHIERAEFLRESLAMGHCVVAESETQLAGFAILNYKFFGFGFIPLVVVASANRREGVGTRLLAALELRCTSAKLFSSANLSNVAAHGLFAHAGFIVSGRVENLDPDDPEVILFKVPKSTNER